MRLLILLGLLAAWTPAFIVSGTAQAKQDTGVSRASAFVIANAARQESPGLEQELADRYAPVVYLRQVNNDICDTANEGFDPVAVDFVLERDDIPLVVSDNGEPSGNQEIVTEAPMASDLYGREAGHYLDYPGSPLSPGCTYRRDFSERRDEASHVAYAHIFREPGTSYLVLQYWMYYYLNDWNNTHEGDWEMIMLFFDAETVEEALSREPEQVVYAQHGGGEKADWQDDKLSKEDGHPVVYVARGAHASQFEPKIFLGLAENGTGFGCENAKGPHRRIALDAVVVPHEPTGPDDPHAWLGFTGRWGELRKSEWNGPTGPNTKTSWNEPVTWAEGVRDTSLVVPEFEGFGQAPVDLFCGIVGAGSAVLVAFSSTPALTVGFIGIVLVTTSWIASYALSTVRRAFSFYRAHLRIFALIGAMLIPTGVVVALIQTALFAIPPIEPLLKMMERFPGVRIFLLLAIGSFQVAVAVIFVAPAVIVAMAQLRQGAQPGVIESYRRGVHMIWRIFLTRVRIIYRAFLDAITIVGIPRAIRRILAGLFVSQAISIHDAQPETAIEDSFRATESGLARSIATNVVLYAIVLFTGPIVAIFLMLAIPSRPLGTHQLHQQLALFHDVSHRRDRYDAPLLRSPAERS